MKNIFDFIISVLILFITSPILLICALLIKLDDKGPVFYLAQRVGLQGRLFKMYKFRTMVIDADTIGGSTTGHDDPRITKIGQKLRRYKLDELPQLINVLKGEMSLVGPRPEVKYYTDMFTQEEKKILSVKPGITDWASLWNSDEAKILSGSSDPDRTYFEEIRPQKIKLQLKYVNNHSVWIDIKIILLTLKELIFRK